MGKVYDALQRAEEQRARRATGTLPPASEPEVPSARPRPPESPSEAQPSAPVDKKSLWSRLGMRRAAAKTASTDQNKRRITLLQPESYAAEQFRTLGARIDSIAASRPVKTLAVTSANQGDGKTFSAISLAVVSSMKMNSRVVLVDCDLRKPHVHQSLGLRVDAGLAELLQGGCGLEDAISRVEGTELDVIAVRALPPNPAELLASRAMDELLEQLSARYDRIVLDLPPALGLPDAKVVSGRCDGIVFVVRADQTPSENVNAALEALDRGRVLGLVLNGEQGSSARRYGYS